MKCQVEQVAACRKKMSIEVPADEVTAEYETLVREYLRMARIPGFRPGKAPRMLVENRFRKELREELRDRLLPQAYRAAVTQEKIDVVTVLDVEEVTAQPGHDLRFAVTVDVPPDFALPPYTGLALPAETSAVNDEMVDKQLNALRLRLGKFADISDRPARQGDLAQVDFEGVVDGQPLDTAFPQAGGLGRGQGLWMTAGEESFLPGIGPALAGQGIGQTLKIPVEFGPDFARPELRGKKADYTVTVKGVRERKPAELNAEFLKQMDVDGEDALRAKLRRDLEAMEQEVWKRKRTNAIAGQLLEKTRLDVPESQVRRATGEILQEMVDQHLEAGMTNEQWQSRQQELMATADRSAQERVKLGYILHRIAAENSIAATEEDVALRLHEMAVRYNTDVERVRHLLDEKNQMDNIREQIREAKTMDFLLAQAKIG